MVTFYRTSLKPLGYNELVSAFDATVVGFGSDFPYLWVKQVPEGDKPYATHVAIDAPGRFLYPGFEGVLTRY